MPFECTDTLRVAGHQACIIFDRRTGRIAHVHESLTLEGAAVRSRKDVEARALELAREFATQLSWVEFDQLDVLSVSPDELADGEPVQVDVKARKLVPMQSPPSSLD